MVDRERDPNNGKACEWAYYPIHALSVKMKLTGCQYETGGSQWSVFLQASRSRFAEQAERLHILMISGWMKWKQEYHLDMQVLRQSPDKVGSDGFGRPKEVFHESCNRLSDLYRQLCWLQHVLLSSKHIVLSWYIGRCSFRSILLGVSIW